MPAACLGRSRSRYSQRGEHHPSSPFVVGLLIKDGHDRWGVLKLAGAIASKNRIPPASTCADRSGDGWVGTTNYRSCFNRSCLRDWCTSSPSARDDGGDSRRHIVADGSESFERHVATLELPFVVLFKHQRPPRPQARTIARFVREDTDNVSSTLDFGINAFQRVR